MGMYDERGEEVMAKFSWDGDLVIDLDEMMAYIESMGAASINETKTHFATGSRSVRHAIGRALIEDKIIVTAYGGGIYILPRSGQRGKPNVKKLRQEAGVEPTRRRRTKKELEESAKSASRYSHPGYHPKKVNPDDPFEA